MSERRAAMTLHARDPYALPADTAAVGQRLLAATNSYRLIGDQLADLLRDEQFADLYQSTGRAAVSPAVLALVTLFQFLENVPDRQAAELVVVRLDWKYALHLSLDDPGFDFTVLCYFRGRLLEHGQERRLFDTLLAKLVALGLVKKRGKQRTDALAVLGAVRQLSELETVTETLRLVLGAVAQTDAAWLAGAIPPSFREQYVETRPDYRLTAAERTAALRQAGADAAWLLAQLAAAPAPLPTLAVVQTLRTVWAQRYERRGDRIELRTAPAPCTERIVTPTTPACAPGRSGASAGMATRSTSPRRRSPTGRTSSLMSRRRRRPAVMARRWPASAPGWQATTCCPRSSTSMRGTSPASTWRRAPPPGSRWSAHHSPIPRPRPSRSASSRSSGRRGRRSVRRGSGR